MVALLKAELQAHPRVFRLILSGISSPKQEAEEQEARGMEELAQVHASQCVQQEASQIQQIQP